MGVSSRQAAVRGWVLGGQRSGRQGPQAAPGAGCAAQVGRSRRALSQACSMGRVRSTGWGTLNWKPQGVWGGLLGSTSDCRARKGGGRGLAPA